MFFRSLTFYSHLLLQNHMFFNNNGTVFLSVTESGNWIKRICRFNGISTAYFVCSVIEIMDKKTPKLNTLFLYGGSNTGKSNVTRSIVDGMLVIGQTTRSDTFLFQDLPGAQVFLMEKLRIVL